MIMITIYIVAASSTLRICKFCRILLIVAFVTLLKYPLVVRNALIRFQAQTRFYKIMRVIVMTFAPYNDLKTLCKIVY